MQDILFKLWPFNSGNRMWALVVLQAWALCMLVVVLFSFIMNAMEGEKWQDVQRFHGGKQRSFGDSALDECFWFVSMSMHGMTFGEFMPISDTGHVLACIIVTVGFWFNILMLSCVLLSQLPGRTVPQLPKVCMQVFSAAWPSYLIYAIITLGIGSQMGDKISKARIGYNDKWTGMYFFWTVAHRAPFGDIWPDHPESRTVTVPMTMMSVLYPCYVLALVAVRRPNSSEHQQLLEYMNEHPEQAMGRGYIVPNAPREVQMTAAA
eukprot:TRINITY_DN114214_c0_g1_i1.p1 TRINITY_DN114214_c0_g1~~TRINITY_DN114214_c0_g1_i1.p1  ORF type:complete len:282 (+),score=42.72 TRINITY_DN114214_c0_g1_i1:57-848(+)